MRTICIACNATARHRISLFALLLLVSAVLPAQAQPAIFFSGGMAAPISPSQLTDNWKTGYSIGIATGLPITDTVMLQSSADYARLPFKFTEAMPSGLATKMLSVTGNLLLSPSLPGSAVRPYALIGAGYFRFWDMQTTVEDAEGMEASITSDTALGFNTGGGIYFIFAPGAAVFTEARFLYGLTEGDGVAYSPVRVGLAFQR